MSNHSKLLSQALTYLTRRDHSEWELRQKLKRKGFMASDIEVVLNEVKAAGYLNENRYIEHFIHYYRNRGYGPLRIKALLNTKGIATEMIAQHIDLSDNTWLIAAQRIWQKHYQGKIGRDLKTRAKQVRFLQYRGFTQDHIESILRFSEEN